MPPVPAPAHALPAADVLTALQSDAMSGLSEAEAKRRLHAHGTNTLTIRGGKPGWLKFLLQFNNPLLITLLVVGAVKALLGHPRDALVIWSVTVINAVIGFVQESKAENAIAALARSVRTEVEVVRGGVRQRLASEQLVPGDLVQLEAGARVPADLRLLETRHLQTDESALTGESLPVHKGTTAVEASAPLAERIGMAYAGSYVTTGQGLGLVVATGDGTEVGTISTSLQEQVDLTTPLTRKFGRFSRSLLQVILVLAGLTFLVGLARGRGADEMFDGAVALAVGAIPEELPAIVTITLAIGVNRMARRRAIIRKLPAVETLGSTTVICSDKTGTLTEGTARLRRHCGIDGQPSQRVLLHAVINASFETGFPNPIDAGLRDAGGFDLSSWGKLDEIPFDFGRKRQSILARPAGSADGEAGSVLITKGALQKVLEVCDRAECSDGSLVPLETVEAEIRRTYADWSGEGDRLLGVAIRPWWPRGSAVPLAVGRDAEAAMIFLGMVALSDPLKPAIRQTVAELDGIGVRLKIITGDNALVAARIGRDVGLRNPEVLTGRQLVGLSDAALPVRAQQVDVFAEIEPSQKERLIRALRQAGHVVGYMGDGINDAPALHAADVSVSVQGAVDVAREAADIVLLEADLAVLVAGIREGRRTFANTLKYVFMATSANFGNMFSMAGASLLLPFLPLLPKQILLTNLLTDLPEMTIATDRVDPDWIDRPHRWSIPFIKRFMLTFGLVSSVYDYLTFVVLLWVLNADPAQFRTGWFMESVVSAASIVLVIRTKGPLFRSRPSRWLVGATMMVVGLTLLLPWTWTGLGRLFGFVPLPAEFLFLLALILAAYIWSAEQAKGWFYRQGGRFRPDQGLR